MALFLSWGFGAAAAGQTVAAPAGSGIDTALRPALEKIGPALQQVHIDRWKLSRQWKDQFQSDAGSIQQDLTGQLPALMTAAQVSSGTLAPQVAVMHNVDALYDVLVRISTAANIAGRGNDAAVLDSALQQLESARKAAAGKLLQVVTLRDQQIASLQAAIQTTQKADVHEHPKTIVVTNRVTHRRRHHSRTAAHHKPAHKKAPHQQPAATTTPPSGSP